MILVLNDTNKKTPVENRINVLNNLNSIVDSDLFLNFESFIVDKFLPIILKRLTDAPKVIELAGIVGFKIISKLSIQSFPFVISKLFLGLSNECKWKTHIGTLKLLQSI